MHIPQTVRARHRRRSPRDQTPSVTGEMTLGNASPAGCADPCGASAVPRIEPPRRHGEHRERCMNRDQAGPAATSPTRDPGVR